MVKIEERTIDFVPENERHGKARSLFFIWFGINMSPLTLGTGAVLVINGLSFGWSVLAIILGNLLATLLMAAHSAQGPHLGIPQMIQSRAQFGVFGAIIPLIMVFLMYVGYASSGAVYPPEIVYSLFPECPIPLWALVFISYFIVAIIVIFGYDAIHEGFKWVSIVMGILFAIITISAIMLPVPEGTALGFGKFDLGLFLMGIAIPASWQACYAPYVADYSRYLPKSTKTSHTFWTTYLGASVGATWMMVLGCYIAVVIPSFYDNQMSALAGLFPLPVVFLVISFVLLLVAMTLNLYGLFMSFTSIIEPFTSFKFTRKARVLLILALTVVVCIIGSFAGANFWSFYSAFLSIILYFLIPWTSINLVDFYFIRHGHYDVDAMYNPNGKYGKWNLRTLAVYFLTILVEIPFVSLSFYQGPIAKMLDGGEIAWFVGGVFAAVVYYLVSRKNIIPKDSIQE